MCPWAPFSFSVLPSTGYLLLLLWSCPALWFRFVAQQLYTVSHVLHPCLSWAVFVSLLTGGTLLWYTGLGCHYVAKDGLYLPVCHPCRAYPNLVLLRSNLSISPLLVSSPSPHPRRGLLSCQELHPLLHFKKRARLCTVAHTYDPRTHATSLEAN